MENSISLSGEYNSDDGKVMLHVNHQSTYSEKRLQGICEEILQAQVSGMRIELEADFFIYFHADSKEVRFVSGKNENFGALQRLVKFNGGPVTERAKAAKPNAASTKSSLKTTKSLTKAMGPKSESALIQNSLLPSITEFKKAYANAEVLFAPLEAPGGDFYWIKNYQHKSLTIVGDCTGHGMEGAMIAMSVITLIKQNFRLPPISIQAAILDFYSSLMAIVEDELGNFDVELGFLLKDLRNGTVEYIGSGVNLAVKEPTGLVEVHRTRKLKTLKGGQPIVKLIPKPGDQLVMFTDGIPDQFNASNNRKLGTVMLQEILQEIDTPLSKQKFLKSFNKFRGKTKPMDDQTMVILTT